MSALDISLYRHDPMVEPATSEKEINTVQMVLQMYEAAKQDRERWDPFWRENWNFFIGKHYKPRAKWKSSPKENFVLSKTRVMLAMLTDNRPRISVLPATEEYAQYADQMNAAVNALWDRIKMRRRLGMTTLNGLLFGTGFFYNYWDPDKEEICTEALDTQCVFRSPRSTCVQDARYLIHVGEMSPQEILARWPEAEGKFGPGTRTVGAPDHKDGGVLGLDDAVPYHGTGPAYDYGQGAIATVPWSRSELYEKTDQDQLVEVLQCWVRDHTFTYKPYMIDGIHAKDDESGEYLYEQRQKYPGGRLIIIAGGRVLHDGPNPYKHGRFPYAELFINQLPGEGSGLGAVQNLVPIQKELNKTLGQIIDNKNLMGHGQWKADSRAGVKAKLIRAIPGLVIKYRFGGNLEKLETKPLPNYIVQFVEHCMLALDRVSGVSDVTEGRKPTGITAGIAIESLQEAAQAVMRLDVGNLEDALQETGEQWIGLMQQYYEGGRVVRVTDPQTHQYTFYRLTDEAIRGQWELMVAPGSTLPRSREARFGQALQAYQAQLFDRVEALKFMDHPGRDEALRRLQAADERQIQLAAQGVDLQKAMGGRR